MAIRVPKYQSGPYITLPDEIRDRSVLIEFINNNVTNLSDISAISGSMAKIDFARGTIVITGSITASHYHIQDVTQIDSTGSTFFGNTNDDVHARIGSLRASTLQAPVFWATASANGATPYVGIGTNSPDHTLTVAGSISGSTTFQAVGVSILGGALDVSGAVGLASTLGVDGLANLDGGIEIDNSGNKFTVSTAGVVVAAGKVTADEFATDNSAFVVTTAGTISGSSTLQAVGNTIFGGELNVSGATTLAGSLSSSAGTEIVGNSVIVGNLNVSGTQAIAGVATYEAHPIFETGITIKNADASAGYINFYEQSSNGTNVCTFRGKSSMGNCTITLPGQTGIVVLEDNTVTLSNKTIDDTTLTGDTTAATISASSTLHAVGAATFGATVSTTGSISGSNTLQTVGATTLGNTLSVSGTVTVAGDIVHAEDPDTYLRFEPNLVNLVAGGQSAIKLQLSNGKIQLNNGNDNLDVQMMADDGEVILHTDATTNKVGIGTDAPSDTLTVAGNISGSSTLQAVGNTFLGGTLNVSGAITATDTSTLTTVDINGGAIDGTTIGAASPSTIVATTITANTKIIPDAVGGADLGATDAEWGDLYIADDKKIHFGNGQDASIEYDEDGTDELRFAGAAVTFEQAVTFDGAVTLGDATGDDVTITGRIAADIDPKTNNTYDLGNASLKWKDIYVDGVGYIDKIGIGVSTPLVNLDVHHNPTGLEDDTGGGEVITFGTEDGTQTLAAGRLMYLHSGSSKWLYTDANNSESGSSQLLGIALGNAVSDGILLRGWFDAATYLSGTFKKGQQVYVSTGGSYIQVHPPSGSDNFLRSLGYCTTQTNVIYFNPSSTYIEIS